MPPEGPSGVTRGEAHDPESHLIPLVLDVALGRRKSIRIYGEDYPTPDGTCIRDYIHVSDLADAHLLIGKVHLRNGRTHEAVAALKISIWSAETAEAHVLLAQAYLQSRDSAAARAEAERALVLAPASAEARRVLEQTIER